jgi:hypothetical protein
MMKNPFEAELFRVPIHVGQTSIPCKAPPLHGSGKTPTSLTDWLQRIVFTQRDPNLKPDENATKTNFLTT